MKKSIILLILCISIISCNKLSKEELLIHNQKVSSGIDKKKADLDKILSDIGKQSDLLIKNFDDVNSFKLGRSSSKKKRQISELEKESEEIYNHRERVRKLKRDLDLLHQTFDFQSNPKLVVERIFSSAKNKDFSILMWLADPYDENDSDVDRIAYTETLRLIQQNLFVKTFEKGKIIGEPIITKNTAKIDFLFGWNGDRKETMNLVKRNESWYLFNF